MAARYWLGTGGDALWSNLNNWGSASGTGAGVSVPLITDDIIFDGGGNNPCTVSGANRPALSLTVASGYTSTITFTFNLAVSGSINIANSAHTMAGGGLLRQIVSSTLTTNGKTIGVALELGGTTTSTVTLGSALVCGANLTLTNSTSTIFAGAFSITAPSCTISGSQTLTLANDININGTTTFADANIVNGAFFWNTYSLVMNGAVTGTAKFRFVGTGSWSGANPLSNSVDINCGSNTLTLTGTVFYAASGTPTLNYIDGTIAASGIISVATACTFANAGSLAAVYNNLTITAAATVTFTCAEPGAGVNTITFSGTVTMPNAATTFAGNGITIGTWANTAIGSSSKIYTLAASAVYQVVTAFNLTGVSAALTLTLTSSSGTVKTGIDLQPGCTQDVGYVTATRIDSAIGRPVFDYKGTLNTCFNWFTDAEVFGIIPPRARPQLHIGM